MSDIYVKYKLIPTQNGLITPSEIYDGGYVWEAGSLEDMVLIGKVKKLSKNKPEGIISKITKKKLDEHKKEQTQLVLKKYKKEQYQSLTDHLFTEAFREKELGNDTKWKEYLEKCEEIKNIKKS